MGLTNKQVEQLEPNDKRYREWDDRVSAFGVRVYPSGTKVFFVMYRRPDGRGQRNYTIGRFPALTVRQAREIAEDVLYQVKRGVDPIEEKEKKRIRGATFDELATAYLSRYAKVKKKTWRTDERRINKYLLPAWSETPIAEIDHVRVWRLHHEIGIENDHPSEANRVRSLVMNIFNRGVNWGLVDPSTPNPAARVEKFEEKPRDRWLKPEEVVRLAAELQDEQRYMRCAFWLLLLTGQRKSEILELRWGDVDMNRRQFHLEDTKNGTAHDVAISEPIALLLEGLPREPGNPYVLPGRVEGQCLQNINKAWSGHSDSPTLGIRQRARLEDVTIHDFRHTFATWCAHFLGITHVTIAQVLNHSLRAGATSTYINPTGTIPDTSRDAMERYAWRVLEVAELTPTQILRGTT